MMLFSVIQSNNITVDYLNVVFLLSSFLLVLSFKHEMFDDVIPCHSALIWCFVRLCSGTVALGEFYLIHMFTVIINVYQGPVV